MFTVFQWSWNQVWRRNTNLQRFLRRKSVLMVSGEQRVNIFEQGGMKGGGLKVLSVVAERILTNPPPSPPLPSMIQHPWSSNISKFPYICAPPRNCGKDCILRNSCWGAVEHVLERLWGPVKPPLDTHQQITIYSVAEKRKNGTIKNKTMWDV